jgi:hypothetical protein
MAESWILNTYREEADGTVALHRGFRRSDDPAAHMTKAAYCAELPFFLGSWAPHFYCFLLFGFTSFTAFQREFSRRPELEQPG